MPEDRVGGNDCRGAQDSFWSDRKGLYLHWGDSGYMGVYRCRLISNYTLEVSISLSNVHLNTSDIKCFWGKKEEEEGGKMGTKVRTGPPCLEGKSLDWAMPAIYWGRIHSYHITSHLNLTLP